MFDQAAQTEIIRIANSLGAPPAALLAVAEVESGGQTTALVDGAPMPLIRWEGHYFWRHLPASLRSDAVRKGLAAQASGVVKNPKTQQARYNLLGRARAIHDDAALMSCSWGLGQVMGANFADLGYPSVSALVAEATSGVVGQVALMAKFIRRNKLIDELQRLDFTAFARAYNGPNFGDYDEKMRRAHRRWASAQGLATPAAAPPVAEQAFRLSLGDRGQLVIDLQVKLRRAGHFLHADGDYGPATRSAVAAFQRDNDLPETGVADLATLAKLDARLGV